MKCFPLWLIGNTAPFLITQPSTDNHVLVVTSTTTQVNLTCSLNITIPPTMVIVWFRNDSSAFLQGLHTGNTATLPIINFQPSDTGGYQCVFSDLAGSGWTIRRNIILVINGMCICSHDVRIVCIICMQLWTGL